MNKLFEWLQVRTQSKKWDVVREEILNGLVEIASIPTKNYKEVIEVRVPTRFYWDEDGFDGIEFGEFSKDLMPWQEEMMKKCLLAIAPSLHSEESPNDQ